MDKILLFIREWRIITISLLIFLANFSSSVFTWYQTLDNPTNGQSALASSVILAIVPALFSWTGSRHNSDK